MELRKIKNVLLVLFVLFAGILYSCNNKNDGDIVSIAEPAVTNEDSDFHEDSDVHEDRDINEDTSLEQGVEDSNNNDSTQDGGLITQEQTTDILNFIYVHISGAVNNPGVYEANEHTRVYELIDVAGGFTDDAAGDYINQAAIVTDGEQIYIPTMKEVEESTVSLPITSSNQTNIPQDEKISKVNINTAGKEELMTLTGIGESKANSIIEYRNKYGVFKRIEDIMNISGIKEAAFNKISDNITVD